MCNHQVRCHRNGISRRKEVEAIITPIYRYMGTCCTPLLDAWAVAATDGCRRLSRIEVPFTNWHAGRAYDAMQPVLNDLWSRCSMDNLRLRLEDCQIGSKGVLV